MSAAIAICSRFFCLQAFISLTREGGECVASSSTATQWITGPASQAVP